jgi:two-component system copper resistance phosphate regulon response regulator CusR
VDHADNGLTGYHLAMTAEYDLVILDIMLPDVNGWDIIRMLRTAGKGMPVLLLTALGTIEHRVKGLNWVRTIIWLNPLRLLNCSPG